MATRRGGRKEGGRWATMVSSAPARPPVCPSVGLCSRWSVSDGIQSPAAAAAAASAGG